MKVKFLFGCIVALSTVAGASWVERANAFPLVVQPGDTLAGIAARMYGRVQNEKLLVSANGLSARGGVAIVAGMRLEVPAVGHRSIQGGETWQALAEKLLGGRHRAAVLAFANDSKPWLRPAADAEIIVPYNLPYVAEGGETLAGLASRFYGSKKRAWMLSRYNGLSESTLERGDLVLLPLTDLALTQEGRIAAGQAAGETASQARGQRRARQRSADAEIATLFSDVRAGRYVEVVARGEWLRARGDLTRPQRAAVQRRLLEAYAALGAEGRAREACEQLRQAAPHLQLDPERISPKLLSACSQAE